MQLEDWGARWRDGQIGWHQSNVTGALEEYGAQVLGSDPGRVLVPLCGKTIDMVFLAENAKAVVGVEYAEQAVREFFDEHGLSPHVDGGQRYLPGEWTDDESKVFQDEGSVTILDAAPDDEVGPDYPSP